ncbi:MAG TPA: hypothetical protein VIE43_02730 [Thermoanaerobaculia bacterium]|jgi:hypothetical protein|nr:hypothetical protein [Thermoanaerobaculia bacterium]
MSFKSMDLMIDVLPTAKFNALLEPAGLGLCTLGTATAGGGEDDDEEGGDDDDLGCVQGTAAPTTNEPTAVFRSGMNLALLRQQLHATLAQD